MTDLRQAAQAVLDRWDSPQWEWVKNGPTADLMHTLREALAAPQPLTDDFLRRLHHIDEFGLFCDYDEFEDIARAIERAHNIGGGA